ncbi:nucleotidyltransferase domain-containing protein [Nocardioides guangzhouensis]|uniref:Nucleotidyltransferase domain-containing protein n=1 Tax=Nocardioides guangzhouensis TaxID=2497878 RepID=A0A4V1XXY6_9ACTN|nr:nucleotidyltransferase domain-containing protein [Nocardioides guangzhouensis]RYP81379.1 nucleotidyltransferase domain-containing protein [Nocardioides guangzhouensis]
MAAPLALPTDRYDDLLAWLPGFVADDPDLRCAWLGGSAATGGFDEWSDIDVVVLATPGTAASAYDRMLAAIRATFAPDHVWELPEPTWPDGRQCFVNLQARAGLLAEPTRLVDLAVLEVGDTRRVIDVRRHGTPLVLHDPDGLIELRHDDPEELARGAAAANDQSRQRWATAEWLVNRAVARDQLPEAVALYLRFGLTPLVQLLRTKHCPERHDYGLRYLHTDLPSDVAARVTALLPGTDRLRELSAECFAWQAELLADLA